MDVAVKRRGRPPKNAVTPQTQAPVQPVDLDKIKLKLMALYGETQKPRYDCDHNGHDLARMVGYLERGLEELMDELGGDRNA